MAHEKIVADLRGVENEAASLIKYQANLESIDLLMKANDAYNRAAFLLMQTREAFQKIVPVLTRSATAPITYLSRGAKRSRLDDRIAAILGEERFFALSLAYWTPGSSSDAVMDYVSSHPIDKDDTERRKAICHAFNARGWSHEANTMIDLTMAKKYECMRDLLARRVTEGDLLCTRAEIELHGESQCLWVHGDQRVVQSIPKRK
ncbi:MAG: hypothetical protein ABL890_01420 [Candidatus Peribacteraceae bacterium]